jgi:hypothetical protein
MSGLIAVTAIFLVFGFFVLVFWAANSRRAGERGWVYNRYNPRPRRTGTLGLLESIYQPSIEHVIEERSSQKARGDQAESGDKPLPGEADC